MKTRDSATLSWLTWLGINSYVRQEQKRSERALKEEVRRCVKEYAAKKAER